MVKRILCGVAYAALVYATACANCADKCDEVVGSAAKSRCVEQECSPKWDHEEPSTAQDPLTLRAPPPRSSLPLLDTAADAGAVCTPCSVSALTPACLNAPCPMPGPWYVGGCGDAQYCGSCCKAGCLSTSCFTTQVIGSACDENFECCTFQCKTGKCTGGPCVVPQPPPDAGADVGP